MVAYSPPMRAATLRPMFVLAACLAVPVGSVVACKGSDPGLTDAPDVQDASLGPVDAETPRHADATVGGPSAGGELLVNGDFENAGCEGWTKLESLVNEEPLPHEGRRACRVCSLPGASVYGLAQRVPAKRLQVGTTYAATAWVRGVEDGGTSTALHLALHLDDGAFSEPVGGGKTAVMRLDAAWQQPSQTMTYTARDGGTYGTVELLNRAADEGCFVVDQASLARVK